MQQHHGPRVREEVGEAAGRGKFVAHHDDVPTRVRATRSWMSEGCAVCIMRCARNRHVLVMPRGVALLLALAGRRRHKRSSDVRGSNETGQGADAPCQPHRASSRSRGAGPEGCCWPWARNCAARCCPCSTRRCPSTAKRGCGCGCGCGCIAWVCVCYVGVGVGVLCGCGCVMWVWVCYVVMGVDVGRW